MKELKKWPEHMDQDYLDGLHTNVVYSIASHYDRKGVYLHRSIDGIVYLYIIYNSGEHCLYYNNLNYRHEGWKHILRNTQGIINGVFPDIVMEQLL